MMKPWRIMASAVVLIVVASLVLGCSSNERDSAVDRKDPVQQDQGKRNDEKPNPNHQQQHHPQDKDPADSSSGTEIPADPSPSPDLAESGPADKNPADSMVETDESHDVPTDGQPDQQNSPGENSNQPGQSAEPDSGQPAADPRSDADNGRGDAVDSEPGAGLPRLMNVFIGENKESVLYKHGEPLTVFVMEHETDPVSVYRYDGYDIGFNRQQKVEFVSITGEHVSTGLGGIKLGDSVTWVIQILGNPDQHSPYVMNYRDQNCILKLDINPDTNTISSIKLFALHS